MAKKNFEILTLLLVILIISIFSARIISQQKNILFENGQWESSKIKLHRGVVGAVAFYTTRTALWSDRLNLGTWHAYNQVVTKRAFQPIELSFTLNMSEVSDLTVFFEFGEMSQKGIRFTANKNYVNEYVETDPGGLITERQTISSVILPANTDTQIKLIFQGLSLAVLINEIPIGTATLKYQPLASRIAFKSQAGPTFIDNVRIHDLNGTYFNENFQPPHFWLWFWIMTGTLANVALMYRIVRGSKFNLHWLLLTAFNLLFITGFLFSADYLYFAKIYPVTPTQVDKLVRYINTSVFKNNIEYEDAIFKRLAAQFETLKSGHYTVVLMGSSQTWGAGAATAADKLETYLQNGLRAQHRKSDVTLINTAVSGASLSRMWKAIEPYREKRIDLIILNASNNDFDAASFRRELQKLSDFAIEKNIVLVLVGEANYFMDPNWNIFENHKSMRQLASAQGWKFINMHEEMAAIYNLGYFWWDNVHMTSAGQKKVSEIILKNLR